MNISIRSASGKNIEVDFDKKTLHLVQSDTMLKMVGYERAHPASKGHTSHKDWPSNATHYILIDKLYITLDAGNAETFNNADKEYSLTKIQADKQALDIIIPGLSELIEAIEAEEHYSYLFNKMMEDEHNDGVNPPSRPETSTDELRQQYPRAALYVKACTYSNASNDRKATAGDKATSILIKGGDINEAAKVLDGWLDGVYID